MRKSTYIDYAVLMAVRSGKKNKKDGKGLMLIAHAFEQRQKRGTRNDEREMLKAKRGTRNAECETHECVVLDVWHSAFSV